MTNTVHLTRGCSNVDIIAGSSSHVSHMLTFSHVTALSTASSELLFGDDMRLAVLQFWEAAVRDSVLSQCIMLNRLCVLSISYDIHI